jgi:hypothetical protein
MAKVQPIVTSPKPNPDHVYKYKPGVWQAEDGKSFIGPLFAQHFGLVKACDGNLLPKVEVKIKIVLLRDLDIQNSTIYADFFVMLDWNDPSLQDTPDPVDFSMHFYPAYTIQNAGDDMQLQPGSTPRRKSFAKKPQWVTLTQRWKGTLRCGFDISLYPFDFQNVDIKLKSRTISNGNPWVNGDVKGLAGEISFANPLTHRPEGHKFEAGGDQLDEYDLNYIYGDPTAKDCYTFQINLTRDPTNILWNLVLACSCVLFISLVSFGFDANDLGNRSNIALTMLLTLVALKFVLNDRLPKVPLLNLLDKYVVLATSVTTVQPLFFMVQKLRSDMGYISSVVPFDDLAERIAFLVFLGIFFIVHIYFGYHYINWKKRVTEINDPNFKRRVFKTSLFSNTKDEIYVYPEGQARLDAEKAAKKTKAETK